MMFRLQMPRLFTNLPHKRVVGTTLVLLGLGVGGCAQSPQQLAVASHGREYFPSSVYGAASRRVVADGQPIPHGGGQYLVGKPYTVAGQTYYPSERHIVQVGNASWYGDAFHGRLTANGEIYDRNSFTAAHPTMPLPSYARVTNLKNNYSMIVRVNDRGPYASNRIMDVSRGVAEALDFKRSGTAKVKIEYVGRASLAGSDDAKLYATLRQDGPAHLPGEEPTMVASAAPRARVASLAPYAPAPAEDVRQPEYAPRPVHTTRADAPWHDPAPRSRQKDDREDDGNREPREASSRQVRSVEIRDVASRNRDDGEGTRFAMAEMRRAPLPPAHMARAHAEAALLPPSRPLDLGTIPGAGSQIGRRHVVALRMTRARDDD